MFHNKPESHDEDALARVADSGTRYTRTCNATHTPLLSFARSFSPLDEQVCPQSRHKVTTSSSQSRLENSHIVHPGSEEFAQWTRARKSSQSLELNLLISPLRRTDPTWTFHIGPNVPPTKADLTTNKPRYKEVDVEHRTTTIHHPLLSPSRGNGSTLSATKHPKTQQSTKFHCAPPP